jgi:hypothetical protein
LGGSIQSHQEAQKSLKKHSLTTGRSTETFVQNSHKTSQATQMPKGVYGSGPKNTTSKNHYAKLKNERDFYKKENAELKHWISFLMNKGDKGLWLEKENAELKEVIRLFRKMNEKGNFEVTGWWKLVGPIKKEPNP